MLNPAMNWQRDAVCGPDVADLMTADSKPSDEYVNRLGQICATCPVTVQCARYALSQGPVGFWAGVWVYHRGPYRQQALRALRRKAAIA